MADRAAQAELGWRAEAGLMNDRLIVRLQDAEAEPLTGQVMVGELRRLATDQGDVSIGFQPAPRGEYFADVEPLAAGQWLLRVSVLDAAGEQTLFRAEKTLIVS